MENKASLKQLTSVKDQIDENTNNKLKEILSVNKAAIGELERKTKDNNDKLWDKLESIDKNLVGRMSELEALFGSRAATKYVEDSLKELEERLKRTVELSNPDGLNRQQHGGRHDSHPQRPRAHHQEGTRSDADPVERC